MIQDSEAIDGPSRQDGVTVNTAALIPVPAARMLQFPELGDKPAIEALGGTDLEKVVALVAGPMATDIDLLDAEDVSVQLGQGIDDLFGFVVALDVPLQTSNGPGG